MKKLLTLFFCLIGGVAHAQEVASALRTDAATKLLTYSETVLVPDVSQADLYARAQSWLATAYQTKQEATPAPTQTASMVRGTGWREIEMLVGGLQSTPLNLWYTITIAVQQGRYTYVITEFKIQHEPTVTDASPAKQAIESVMSNAEAALDQTDYRSQVIDVARAIGATIKENMLAPAAHLKAGKS